MGQDGEFFVCSLLFLLQCTIVAVFSAKWCSNRNHYQQCNDTHTNEFLLSSSKKLLLQEKLPKPPKGASKLTSFCAILAVRMHAAVRAEGLLAPSSTRFSVDKRCHLCKGLGSLLSYPLLVATLCFNPAEGPQTASRSAECRGRAAMYTGAGSTHTWWATERRLHFGSPTRIRVNSDSCVNDGHCLRLFSVDTTAILSLFILRSC